MATHSELRRLLQVLEGAPTTEAADRAQLQVCLCCLFVLSLQPEAGAHSREAPAMSQVVW